MSQSTSTEELQSAELGDVILRVTIEEIVPTPPEVLIAGEIRTMVVSVSLFVFLGFVAFLLIKGKVLQ